MSGGRFNFPRWNYGYTLGPPTAANAGNYTQFMQPSTAQQYPGYPARGGARPPQRGGSTLKMLPQQPLLQIQTRHQLQLLHHQPILNQAMKSKKKYQLNKRLLPKPKMVSKKKAKSLRGHFAIF